MTTTKGLIFLDSKNAILHEILQPRILDGTREPCEISFSDFDEVAYRVVSPDDGHMIKVNVLMNNFNQYKTFGTQELVNKLYPGLEVKPDSGYNFALEFDLNKVTDGENLLKNVSEIKRNLLAGPLDRAFTALQNKASESIPLMTINYRQTETMFICPGSGKVIVIFLVDFVDSTDRSVARIFLQQFVEAQRSIRTAPPVSFSREPPLELSNERFKYNPEASGFLSFSIEERHIQGTRKDAAMTLLTGFRSYLHYHMKCSKTYLHMRMRKNVAMWLQVLNRSRPEVETEKKTMGGKTFVRK